MPSPSFGPLLPLSRITNIENLERKTSKYQLEQSNFFLLKRDWSYRTKIHGGTPGCRGVTANTMGKLRQTRTITFH